MEIYNNKKVLRLFNEVKIGSVIQLDGENYLKVYPFKVGHSMCNVVNLYNGDYGVIGEMTLVDYCYDGTFSS